MTESGSQSYSLEAVQRRQRGTLQAVLAINSVMFVIIATAALYANSAALLTDSLDNLGDALTYVLSLWALTRGSQVKAGVALVKGLLMLLAACVVAGQIAYRVVAPSTPVFELMGIFSLLGLAGNGLCLYLLTRHRREDLNMSSVWECSRNDIAANASVFVVAGAVWVTDSAWPDIVVASCLVVLLTGSAFRVIRAARRQLQSRIHQSVTATFYADWY